MFVHCHESVEHLMWFCSAANKEILVMHDKIGQCGNDIGK